MSATRGRSSIRLAPAPTPSDTSSSTTTTTTTVASVSDTPTSSKDKERDGLPKFSLSPATFGPTPPQKFKRKRASSVSDEPVDDEKKRKLDAKKEQTHRITNRLMVLLEDQGVKPPSHFGLKKFPWMELPNLLARHRLYFRSWPESCLPKLNPSTGKIDSASGPSHWNARQKTAMENVLDNGELQLLAVPEDRVMLFETVDEYGVRRHTTCGIPEATVLDLGLRVLVKPLNLGPIEKVEPKEVPIPAPAPSIKIPSVKLIVPAPRPPADVTMKEPRSESSDSEDTPSPVVMSTPRSISPPDFLKSRRVPPSRLPPPPPEERKSLPPIETQSQPQSSPPPPIANAAVRRLSLPQTVPEQTPAPPLANGSPVPTEAPMPVIPNGTAASTESNPTRGPFSVTIPAQPPQTARKSLGGPPITVPPPTVHPSLSSSQPQPQAAPPPPSTPTPTSATTVLPRSSAEPSSARPTPSRSRSGTSNPTHRPEGPFKVAWSKEHSKWRLIPEKPVLPFSGEVIMWDPASATWLSETKLLFWDSRIRKWSLTDLIHSEHGLKAATLLPGYPSHFPTGLTKAVWDMNDLTWMLAVDEEDWDNGKLPPVEPCAIEWLKNMGIWSILHREPGSTHWDKEHEAWVLDFTDDEEDFIVPPEVLG